MRMVCVSGARRRRGAGLLWRAAALWYLCMSMVHGGCLVEPDGKGHVFINDAVINTNAFRECSSLKTVSIGSGVESIGYRAFYKATSLETVHFAEGSALKSIGKLGIP